MNLFFFPTSNKIFLLALTIGVAIIILMILFGVGMSWYNHRYDRNNNQSKDYLSKVTGDSNNFTAQELNKTVGIIEQAGQEENCLKAEIELDTQNKSLNMCIGADLNMETTLQQKNNCKILNKKINPSNTTSKNEGIIDQKDNKISNMDEKEMLQENQIDPRNINKFWQGCYYILEYSFFSNLNTKIVECIKTLLKSDLTDKILDGSDANIELENNLLDSKFKQGFLKFSGYEFAKKVLYDKNEYSDYSIDLFSYLSYILRCRSSIILIDEVVDQNELVSGLVFCKISCFSNINKLNEILFEPCAALIKEKDEIEISFLIRDVNHKIIGCLAIYCRELK